MAHIFGTHPVDNGGIHMAVFRSWNAGLQSVQIFTAIPKFYGDKSSIRPDRVEKFRDALATTGMKPEHVMVHAAYVLSVATADPQMWSRAAAGLAKEMERSTELGVGQVCFHPGSATDGDPQAAAKRVADAMIAAGADAFALKVEPVAHQKHFDAVESNWKRLGKEQQRAFLPKLVGMLTPDMKRRVRDQLIDEVGLPGDRSAEFEEGTIAWQMAKEGKL